MSRIGKSIKTESRLAVTRGEGSGGNGCLRGTGRFFRDDGCVLKLEVAVAQPCECAQCR